MSFVVMTDTSANLPNTTISFNDLKVIPFNYIIDGKEHNLLREVRFNAEEFYNRIRKGLRVSTSQIPPQQYADFFEASLKQGKDVLYVSMSSGISSSCHSASLGAELVRPLYPERQIEIVDTLGASLGEGLIALMAARLRNQGVGILEAAEELRRHVARMYNLFTVDDLMHLRRGGRLSNLSAAVGTVLQVKPLLKGDESGKIVAFAKIRGRKKSIEAMAERYERYVVNPQNQIVGIAQAGCADDAARLAELISLHCPPKEIMTVEYEPVTGSHVGPGALALFFEGEEGVRLCC